MIKKIIDGQPLVPNEKQTSWAIVYSNYAGIEAEAIKLLNKEVSPKILRFPEVYQLYVLPCYKVGTEFQHNAFVIGVYKENALLQEYIKPEEVPEDGFCLRIIDRPDHPGCSLVLIAGDTPLATYYAVTEFLDNYLVTYSPYPFCNYFDYVLPPKTYISAPAFKSRRIWTWGHPINDYRAFFTRAARIRINEVVIWNDFAPINAKEVMEYAKNLGIRIVWGFAWGWVTNCGKIEDLTDEYLEELKKQVIDKFENELVDIAESGIYFQSFTERRNSSINGRNVARTVVPLVNEISKALLEKHPNLHIEFGLHSTSVLDDFDVIGQVDPRVEIVWEDGATFPIAYYPRVDSEESFQKAINLVDREIHVREHGISSQIYKGFAILDWTQFAHQAGPYILGEGGQELVDHDTKLRLNYWRVLEGEWTKYGEYAQRMTRHIYEESKGKASISLAGCVADGMWIPVVLAARMLWNPYEEFEDNLKFVMSMPGVCQ